MRAHREPKLYRRGCVWWCYWKDERWSTGCTDEGAAARSVQKRLAPPGDLPTSEKGLGDALALLHDALVRRGRTEVTREIAVQKLGHYLRLWGEHKPLREIDYSVLSEYIRVRLEVDKVKRITVSGEIGYLRQAWKLARAVGWAPRSWDEIMPERFDRKYVPRTRWLTELEVRAVVSSLGDKRAAVVAWIVATGSDLGDVWRAQRQDLDFRRGLVRVRGTKTTFRDRYVPITPLTEPLLRRAAKVGPPFPAWPGVGLALRRLALRLGIVHFSPKDLRRTHGQWLRSAGVEPHLIGRVLGHADSAMADKVYAQGDEADIARLVRMRVAQTRTNRTNVRTNAHGRAATGRKIGSK